MSKEQINEMKKFMQIAEGDREDFKKALKNPLAKAAKLMQDVVDGLGREWEELMSSGDEEDKEFADTIDGDMDDWKKLVALLDQNKGKQAAKMYDSLDTVSREYIYDHLENDEIEYMQKVFGELGSIWLYSDNKDLDEGNESGHELYGKNYSDEDDVETYKVSDDVAGKQMVHLANNAMKYLARADIDKQLMIKLRRMLKALIAEAQNEDIQKAREIAGDVALIANKHRELGDVSWEMNDAEGLAGLHLAGRPIVMFTESNKEKCEKCGREGCTCGPDCDCEPVEENYSGGQYEELALDALKALYKHSQDKRNRKAYKSMARMLKSGDKEGAADLFDEVLGDEYVEVIWTYNDNNRGEALLRVLADGNSLIARSHLSGITAGDRQSDLFATGSDSLQLEDISLENIAESVLNEYRNQPLDYSEDEIDDEPGRNEPEMTDDYEEAEDEELGLRFD